MLKDIILYMVEKSKPRGPPLLGAKIMPPLKGEVPPQGAEGSASLKNHLSS